MRRVDALARQFVTHHAQPLPAVLEDLRTLVAGREALQRSTYSDQCVARLLDHVEQLQGTIRRVAELSAAEGVQRVFNQPEITRLAHQSLATFAPPKG